MRLQPQPWQAKFFRPSPHPSDPALRRLIRRVAEILHHPEGVARGCGMTFIRDCTDNACHTLRSCPSLCGAARPVREDEPCFGPTRNKAPALSEGNRGSAVHVRGISATDEGPHPKSSSQYVAFSWRRPEPSKSRIPPGLLRHSITASPVRAVVNRTEVWTPLDGKPESLSEQLGRGLKMSSSMAPGAGSAGSIETCVGSKI